MNPIAHPPHSSSFPGSGQQCRLVIGADRLGTGGELVPYGPHLLTAGFEILTAGGNRRAGKTTFSPLPDVPPGGGACPGGRRCAADGGGAGDTSRAGSPGGKNRLKHEGAKGTKETRYG